jgi:SAM-dependent methyltransferase
MRGSIRDSFAAVPPDLAPLERVRDDFDRLARLDAADSNHNDLYHDALLRELPARIGAALDIGCGTGRFTRQLAERADSVLGLDLSPEMLRLARARCAGLDHVAFAERDVMQWDLPRAHFDAIASIATLHHLPLAPALERLRDALAPGGTLLVLDIYHAVTPADYAVCALAVPVAHALHLAKAGALRPPPEARAAWEAHGRTDRYLSLRQVRAACAEAGLDGAVVRRRLLFRYSLVWRKPR